MHTPQLVERDEIHFVKSLPFFVAHLLVGLAFVVGARTEWVLLALASYSLRMLMVTAVYHRYFSHRAYQTSRPFQFVLAFLAETSAQKGVLWWAAHHRHHHRFSDQPQDIHSPSQRGFWWSHVGWILSKKYDNTDLKAIRDFAQFPELRWLDRFHLVPPLLGLVVAYAIGGLPWVVWAGIVPTVALWHGTFTINSLTHIFGTRRYLTTDNSRNSFVLALITCGEGWHNNHHFHQNTANQGWFWWELDLSYALLRALSWVRLVWSLRLPSEATKRCFEQYSEEQKAMLREQVRYGAWRSPPSSGPVPVREQAPAMEALSVLGPAPVPMLKR